MRKKFIFTAALAYIFSVTFLYVIAYGTSQTGSHTGVWSIVLLAASSVCFMVILMREITTTAEDKGSCKSDGSQAADEMLIATLNAADDGMIVLDKDKHVIESNRKLFEMWNMSEAIQDFKNSTEVEKNIGKYFVDPDRFISWSAANSNSSVTEHYKAELLDGRIIDICMSPLMVGTDRRGSVWKFRDITSKIKADEELQKSEERYRTLVELCPDAIFVGAKGKIIFCNLAGARLLGASSQEEIYQREISDFIHLDRRSSVKKNFDSLIRNEMKQLTIEHSIIQLNGRSIEIEAVCSAVPHMGDKAVLTVVRDISEKKHSEELKRRFNENIQLVNETLKYDKVRTEYFANISHEIKTPLNVMLGTLQLFELILNEQNDNESAGRMKRYASIMKQNSFRLLRMLNNLIYITEIDSGFIDMNYQNHDLVQLIRDITSASAKFMERKGARLETSLELPELELACDSDKVKRILLNLLSNAVKFTEKGDKIHISLYNDEDFACISVKDTGIGIQEDMKELIFEKFRQVDKSFTRRCEGSGIGLYLAKSLAEMHGGSIEVISKYGEGSEFIVKLPIWQVGDDETAVTAEETSSSYMVSVEFSDIY